MKYIILGESDLRELCDFYELDYSVFQEYGCAILYEDGTLYPYNTYYFSSPICDGLEEDYQFFITHGYTPID